MKTGPQDELWQKIQAFAFDDPNSNFPFSKKLAKENNWSQGFTMAAMEEYRKFIYLCCTLPGGASPSDTVDKVWHLHLTYTQNYWTDFCKNTLQKDIHHHPSKGGAAENDKHVDWYKKTLQLYQKAFGYAPPVDIWPTAHESLQTIDAPLYNKNLFDKTIILFASLTALVVIATGLFKSNGPTFLGYYALLCTAALVISFLLGVHKQRQMEKIVTDNFPADFTTFHATHFIYGTPNVTKQH